MHKMWNPYSNNSLSRYFASAQVEFCITITCIKTIVKKDKLTIKKRQEMTPEKGFRERVIRMKMSTFIIIFIIYLDIG